MKTAKILWRAFLLAIAAFPILGIVQLFSKGAITPYDDYVALVIPVYAFLKGNLEWIMISFLSFIAIAKIWGVKHITQDKIRKRQYYFEYERWKDTPYIPPLLYYYLMAPPTSASPYVKDQVEDDFYPLLLKDFRDRVSISGHFTSNEPGKRASILKVIGFKIMASWILHLAVLIMVLFFVVPELNFVEVLTQTNVKKLLIPVSIYVIGYTTMVAIAVGQTAPWKVIDNKLLKYFEDYLHHEPRIPWTDMLPDTDVGYGVEKMWERDCYSRIRMTYQLKGWIFPHNKEEIEWVNYSIPSNPFPNYLDMSWMPKARKKVKASQERWQIEEENLKFKAIQRTKGQSKGQVIPFHRKR